MKSKITLLSLLAVLFFIQNVSGQCTSGSMYPATAFTPACTGAVETINTDCWAGEYAEINALANKQYTFASSLATDFITITDATGATVYASGTSPLTWSSGATAGTIRYFIHKSSACIAENIGRIRYITCASAASCASPSGVFVTNITSNSARINWTAPVPAPASGYEYYFSTSNTTPLASTVATGATANSVVNVSGLLAATTYYHWVRSNCTSVKSAWVAGGSFTTIAFQSCNGAVFGLYPEATFTPSNTGIPEQIASDSYAGEFSNVNITANKQYVFTSSVATDYITITNANGTIVYAMGTSPLAWNSGATAGVIRYHLHTNAACGTEAVGRIRTITVIDACSVPYNPYVNSLTSTSAVINWSVASVPSNNYDYIVSTSNVAPTNASVPTANINTTSALFAAGVLPNTTYYWWVRSNCGATKSVWVAGPTFTTLSNLGNGCTQGSLYPTATFSPSCSGTQELITNAAYAGEYANVSVANGRHLTFASSNPTDFITITNTAGTQILAYGVTPVVYNIETGATTLRYYIHTSAACGTQNTNRNRYITCETTVCPSPTSPSASGATESSVVLSWSSPTTPGSGYEYYISSSDILSNIATGTSASASKTVYALTSNTTYYFWVRSVCTAGSKSNWVSGGTFTTLAPAACNAPTNLSVSNITSNSAYINFTAAVPQPLVDYEYYVNTVNVAPTAATVQSGYIVGVDQANIAGLNASQTYFYWLRSGCSPSSRSAWVAGGSFTTLPSLNCNGTAGAFGLWPRETFTPACTGIAEEIATNSWAGEFTNVTITTGKQYTFTSSEPTDYMTITNAAGNIVYASGTTPLSWYSGNNSGVIRYFLHSNASCGTEQNIRTRSITCATPVISLVGDGASGWDTDVYMATTDGITYTLNNYTLTTGGVKFRQDSNWIINWGNSTFPTGTGVQDGANIPAVACNYNITFNLVTRAYSFVSTSSQPVKPSGNGTQSLCNGATLANFAVTGTNIQWYDSATGGTLLASNTPLVNGTTYYASQSNGTCESLLRLAVTANITTIPPPTAPANQTFCLGKVVGNLVSTGISGASRRYYNVPVDGASLPPPALLATGTYYISQVFNNCESARTPVNVVVNSNTPTFTAVAPICSGAALSPLPTTSNNGITGTWSPALNNTATTTYTFTPTVGQCATTTTLTITVNQNVAPTFTAVAPICSGAALAALPTTSNNGITGTWSPALNNTATTTYTFTPTVGQCAATTTMTITVNQKVTPTFTPVAAICSGATLAALPVDSTNGINGSWSPALNNTATTTYTFTPSAGQCANTTTMTITVNPNVTPTFTAVAPICSGATLAALPTTSNNGITGSWSPVLNNTATTTYTFTPTAGQCGLTTTMTITVTPNVTPTFTAVAPICSGGALFPLPTTSNNGITGTWSPALNNTATTTYTFTPTAGQCATTKTLVIAVNPILTPTFTAVAPICSGAPISALPTTSNNGITGTWSPPRNNTATTTYTFMPNIGQCASSTTMTITVTPNVTPTFTAVAPICSGTALSALPTTSNNGITGTWSPALNNTATTTYAFTPTAGQCAFTTILSIVVIPNVTPTFTAVAPICSGTALSALPTTSNNGITGTWSPALNNTATTTYTFTPTVGQCAATTTMTITVNQKVTPTFTQVAPICSGTTLAALPTTSNNGITGSWLPSLNNTATTTYTFTPTAGQCALSNTMTITVNPNVTPTFTQVAPICSGTTLAALPTTSNNGITGTWSPALNNTATTTYTFTPTAGQCALSIMMTITVTPNVTPTFTIVAPICSGTALSALPTTSNNGITGSWSPALNNTATTTYTFTATAGQCALTTTMTITVTPNVTPTFTQVAPICSGTTLAALPTTSNNGITGTWSPALNNTATTTYTFTPTAGQCALSIMMTITVTPNVTPTFTTVAPICSGTALSALPTTSNNGITGSWSPALNNTATTTYTFTPTAGQCALSIMMTITVTPNVTPTFTTVAPICSGTALSALPTTSNNGITGSWSPALNNTATTTYTFTPTAGQCALSITMTITVTPNVTPTFTAVAAICSGTALSALPTTSNNGITGSWSPALNNTATTTYTFTPTVGQCALTTTMTIIVNPNVTPTFTAVAPICSGAALSALPTTSNNGITGSWSPALNNTATTTYTFTPTAGQCALTTTMTITVNPNVTPTFTAVAPICSGTALSTLPTTSNNGITGSWSPALNNTATTTYTFTPTAGQCALTTTMTIIVNPNVTPTFTAVAPICSGTALSALPTTSNNGITGSWSPTLNNTATTTYTFTPTAGQCALTNTMTITVNPNVTPTFTAVAAICSGTALSALPTTSNNGITGTWSPALNNTATATYTFTPTAGQCALTTTMTITVTPNVTPTFTAVAPICSGTALSALPTTSNNGITGTWSPSLNNTATTTYTFTPTAGQCALSTTMTITVNPNVTPTFTAVAPICSGTALSTLPTTSNNGITGAWSPALDNTVTTTYTFTPTAGQCALTTTMTITVNPNPVLDEETDITACFNYTLPALTNGSYYTQPGGTGAMLNAGDVITASQTLYVYEDNGLCTSEISFDVIITPAAVIDELDDVVACGSYALPALTATGSYYTGPGGTGTMLNAGDIITSSQTIYVYVLGAVSVCTAESDFSVTITPTPTADVLSDVSACDSYTLPALANGNYYTEAAGAGTMLHAGDAITSTQTVYIYASNGNCTAESDFTVTITPTPTADVLSDVAACDSYTLPALANGNYYTEAAGAGTMLHAGDAITSTQTIYIYASNGSCTAESNFTATITPTPTADVLSDVAACDSYTLPALANGNYYTEAAGAGTMLHAGDAITSTQTIYIYASNGSCTAESDFTVTITPTPTADVLSDVAACDSYTLPALANGNYYTEAAGAGTMLHAGDAITSTQTIYIYASNGSCTAESNFTATITPTPTADVLSDVAACDSYTLPALANGNYYTEAAGAGTMLHAGDAITSTQTVYIYASNGNCTAESSFTVTINTLNNATSLNSGTITANQDNASYQWISCNATPGIIDGETSQSFTATANGQYAVIITLGNCSVTSDCVTIDTLGREDFSMDNLITMYPNPSRGNFTVDTGNIVADSIYVIDNMGRLIVQYAPKSQKSLMDVSRYEDGVYYIKIRYQNKETTKKLILVKN